MRRRGVVAGIGVLGLGPGLVFGGSAEASGVRLIAANGVQIAVQGFGRVGDPVVLLVMGATASMLGWPEAFCAGLAGRGFHVLRFDHRDTGQSTTVPPGMARYAVEDMAADVIGVMDALGVARAHVVGMSLGGLIGQMLALDHAGRVASLTLIAAEPLGWDGPPLPHISAAFMAHFATLGSLDWADEAAVAAFLLTIERLCAGTGQVFDAEGKRRRIAEVLARTESPASMFNHAGAVLREDWTGRFRAIAAPVLVIHGAEDPVLPLANGEAIRDGIAGAGMVVLPGVGHEIPAQAVPGMVEAIAVHVLAAE